MADACKYYLLGTCDRGDKCKFSHQTDFAHNHSRPLPCKYASRPGGCRQEGCPYDHGDAAQKAPKEKETVERPELPDIPLPDAPNAEERAARAAGGLPPRPDDVAEFQTRKFNNSVAKIRKMLELERRKDAANAPSFELGDIEFAVRKFGSADRAADYLYWSRQESLPIKEWDTLAKFEVSVQ
eukprot:s5783_g4.t1